MEVEPIESVPPVFPTQSQQPQQPQIQSQPQAQPLPPPAPQSQVEAPPNEKEKQPKPKPAAPELGESILPMARVQKIMKADKELPNVTKEAVHTISVATEEFIRRLSSAAYSQASRDKRSMIHYKDVALAVKRNPELHFLEEMIPTATPAPQALAQHKLKLAERNSAPTTSTPTNGASTPTSRKSKPTNGKSKPSAGQSTEGTVTPDVVEEFDAFKFNAVWIGVHTLIALSLTLSCKPSSNNYSRDHHQQNFLVLKKWLVDYVFAIWTTKPEVITFGEWFRHPRDPVADKYFRVITTIGHVDHGKTTFVDSLLAANNIISARMAGKIRYMDSREDEQERGITMESSAVSLRFKMMKRSAAGTPEAENFVINLIDTPGHVDFSSEVSSASRLCDGALVLVDVVEGVCSQTITVLRQAWVDRLRPVLVVNKFDRLILELKLSPFEAHHHLTQLIEQVNAVMGSFHAAERMEDDLRWREERERRLQARKEAGAESAENDANAGIEGADTSAEAVYQEKDDEDLYFAPEKGNVIFASAIDGWGFRVSRFAQMYAAKLGIKEGNLRRVLWGDFYLEPKTKRVISYKHLRGRNLKNPDKVTKICSTLDVKVTPRDLKSKDTRQLAASVMSQWLPLATCTFSTVVDAIPPPHKAQGVRVSRMLHPDQDSDSLEPHNKLESDLYTCSTDAEACVVAYVSKMFAVPTKDLPANKKKEMTADEMRARGRAAREARAAAGVGDTIVEEAKPVDSGEHTVVETKPGALDGLVEEDETLIGFARLFSGVLRPGATVYCALPRFDNQKPNASTLRTVKVGLLFTMMGRDLVPVNEVRAGNVFAISGLEGVVWRNATLCSPNAGGLPEHEDGIKNVDQYKDCLVNLAGVARASPIVRVALEPAEPADLPKLIRGLKLLSQADPCVESFQQQTGEWVILTAGELHLEVSAVWGLSDLIDQRRFSAMFEGPERALYMPPPKSQSAVRGTIHGSSAHGAVTFTIRAAPMPNSITDFLQANVSVMRKWLREGRVKNESESTEFVEQGKAVTEEDVTADADSSQVATVKDVDFWPAFEKLCAEAGKEWTDLPGRIVATGPHHAGPNVLVGGTASGITSLQSRTDPRWKSQTKPEDAPTKKVYRDYEDSIDTGFQIATFQGPLCAEPVMGMAYFLEDVKQNPDATHTQPGQITGSMISAVRDACRAGLLDWSPRLKLAMYTCDIQATTEVLGKVYGVVARRRGRIVSEEMKEGSIFFTVEALLPVAESFGFADGLWPPHSCLSVLTNRPSFIQNCVGERQALQVRSLFSAGKSGGDPGPSFGLVPGCSALTGELIYRYELFDQDPFWVPTTEEELEDLGEKADRANIALGYVNAVRKRKGLFVEEKKFEAEKQRTLKK
ncbi:ribosome biogenesis protein Ria1, putative [Rhizoctonia solani AG-1 IA]|uniref:Ribosome biogenesis protein Ria1, putative n=1 Tax=Thanatephorus cucumeris (strain AG1-IA) TaxID=983506 RepID=L8WRH1_THACA|nr:ribosome biogenesis protein Ria1, putative [Rhizoctonia solani AG-1 IA]